MNPDPNPHLHEDFTDARAALISTDQEDPSRKKNPRKDTETKRKIRTDSPRRVSCGGVKLSDNCYFLAILLIVSGKLDDIYS
ncbi:MAG: hypothetical protein FMNOHCHN_01805 [Ignavibacteriaceae bacterium]|nr:hypothetical protein [Ignavibacteriaceae bacterium]